MDYKFQIGIKLLYISIGRFALTENGMLSVRNSPHHIYRSTLFIHSKDDCLAAE